MTLSINHLTIVIELKRLLQGSTEIPKGSLILTAADNIRNQANQPKNPQSQISFRGSLCFFPHSVLFCPTPPLQKRRSYNRSSCYVREAATYEEMGTNEEYFFLSSNSQLWWQWLINVPMFFLFCCIFSTENNEGISKAVAMKYSITTDLDF